MTNHVQDQPKPERRKNQPSTAGEHMENQAGAAKATKDNDLTTGHSYKGDGGDNNAKPKRPGEP